LFRRRGPELARSVETLVPELMNAASSPLEHTSRGALHALRTLARHHLLSVTDALLSMTTPPAEHVGRALGEVLASDSELGQNLLRHLLETMVNSQLFDEKPDSRVRGGVVRSPAHAPHSATCALTEVMKRGPKELIEGNNYCIEMMNAYID